MKLVLIRKLSPSYLAFVLSEGDMKPAGKEK